MHVDGWNRHDERTKYVLLTRDLQEIKFATAKRVNDPYCARILELVERYTRLILVIGRCTELFSVHNDKSVNA